MYIYIYTSINSNVTIFCMLEYNRWTRTSEELNIKAPISDSDTDSEHEAEITEAPRWSGVGSGWGEKIGKSAVKIPRLVPGKKPNIFVSTRFLEQDEVIFFKGGMEY